MQQQKKKKKKKKRKRKKGTSVKAGLRLEASSSEHFVYNMEKLEQKKAEMLHNFETWSQVETYP